MSKLMANFFLQIQHSGKCFDLCEISQALGRILIEWQVTMITWETDNISQIWEMQGALLRPWLATINVLRK